MGFRFRRSIKIAPGVRLNLSKSGVSTSLGVPGATVNLSSRGTRSTVGVPGSGVSFSSFTPKSLSPDGENPGEPLGSAGNGCGYASVVLICFLVFVAILSSIGGKLDSADPTPATLLLDTEQIRTNSGNIDREQLAETAPPAGNALNFSDSDTVYVTASTLNGRASPSASSPVVTQLHYGGSAQVQRRSGEWLQVASLAGAIWIASSHVSRNRPSARPAHIPQIRSYGTNCPCRGSQVCIGPRGGRYCITSGGNKRYGV